MQGPVTPQHTLYPHPQLGLSGEGTWLQGEEMPMRSIAPKPRFGPGRLVWVRRLAPTKALRLQKALCLPSGVILRQPRARAPW